MTRLILASASPARLSVLRSAGVDPIVRVSEVDEDALMAALDPDLDAPDIVLALAQAKAAAVASQLIAGMDGVCWLSSADAFDCVVVGCDSMLYIDGELQGKPGTAGAARQRWVTMAGRSAELLTGHSVIRMVDGAKTAAAHATSATTVHFGRPTESDLDSYVASGEPLQVAGAFTLDGRGGWFIERIEGDPSSVIGIGLPLLRGLLSEVGVDIAALWMANVAERN